MLQHGQGFTMAQNLHEIGISDWPKTCMRTNGSSSMKFQTLEDVKLQLTAPGFEKHMQACKGYIDDVWT